MKRIIPRVQGYCSLSRSEHVAWASGANYLTSEVASAPEASAPQLVSLRILAHQLRKLSKNAGFVSRSPLDPCTSRGYGPAAFQALSLAKLKHAGFRIVRSEEHTSELQSRF